MLLLHTCCAVCAAGCVEGLLAEKREIRLYFSNSNLDTAEEFERRLASVRELAAIYRLELEVDPYRHPDWLEAVAGLEREPEKGARCKLCFSRALGRTASRAEALGATFATTLTVSPHKRSATIFEAGSAWPHFEPLDFKKHNGFGRSLALTAEYGFYRQQYCGCEFSKRA
ncbi:MAG: epoxyqueuosine reductase QueH [Victivallaceae bacterium]